MNAQVDAAIEPSELAQLPAASRSSTHFTPHTNTLHAKHPQVGAAIEPSELAQLLAASDLEGRGAIDYEAFLAAMIDTDR